MKERHRRSTCFRDLMGFGSRRLRLVVNQLVFVLPATSLMQIFLRKGESEEPANATHHRPPDPLLPAGRKVLLDSKHRVAYLGGLENQEPLLDLAGLGLIKWHARPARS